MTQTAMAAFFRIRRVSRPDAGLDLPYARWPDTALIALWFALAFLGGLPGVRGGMDHAGHVRGLRLCVGFMIPLVVTYLYGDRATAS
jgi:hypothetical protein